MTRPLLLLRRQTGRPTDEPKPVSNSKTPPTLLAVVLLAVKTFITHRMSPVPGSPCHATKCLSRSSSVTLVCLPRVCVCMSGIVLAVRVHVSVHCWLRQRSSSHSRAATVHIVDICLSAERLGDQPSPWLRSYPVHLWWWQKRFRWFLLFISVAHLSLSG